MQAMRAAAETDPLIAERVRLFLYRVPEEFYDFENDPDALHNLIDKPGYENEIQSLRDELAQAAADDPEFDRELHRLWRDVSLHSTVNTGGVINTVSGSVAGNVVQA